MIQDSAAPSWQLYIFVYSSLHGTWRETPEWMHIHNPSMVPWCMVPKLLVRPRRWLPPWDETTELEKRRWTSPLLLCIPCNICWSRGSQRPEEPGSGAVSSAATCRVAASLSCPLYRSTTALLCVPVGRSLEHEKQNNTSLISDLEWHDIY